MYIFFAEIIIVNGIIGIVALKNNNYYNLKKFQVNYACKQLIDIINQIL